MGSLAEGRGPITEKEAICNSVQGVQDFLNIKN
jgi:hypothetical protein